MNWDLQNGRWLPSGRRLVIYAMGALAAAALTLAKDWKAGIDQHLAVEAPQGFARLNKIEQAQVDMASRLEEVAKTMADQRKDQLEFYHFWYKRLGAEEQARAVEAALKKAK